MAVSQKFEGLQIGQNSSFELAKRNMFRSHNFEIPLSRFSKSHA